MNNREKILGNIRQRKPAFSAMPEVPDFVIAEGDLEAKLRQSVETGGGKLVMLGDLADYIRNAFPNAKNIVSCIENLEGNVDIVAVKNPGTLENIDVAIIPTSLAVAENGAVWVTEKDSIHRVLPFITQHLVVVVERQHIVKNMHEAYSKIKIDGTGFGVFIAGPSKTADIEQALVIGAQGARSFTLVLK